MAARLFFPSSRGVTERLADMFNFAWPAMAGLWNLRWQVRGYAEVTGKKEIADLHERFVAGSGVVSANLKVACLEASWEDQKSQFARFLLFDLCALYESWLEQVCATAFSRSVGSRLIKPLQRPDCAATQTEKSYLHAIAIANEGRSMALKEDIFPVVSSHPKNSWDSVEELLMAYRYFKLTRNALIHGGGVADAQWIAATVDFKSIPLSKLSFKREPTARLVAVGEKIPVDLSDVVGLGNIVHRLIVTFDAALSVSSASESFLLEQVGRVRSNFQYSLSSDDRRRGRQIKTLIAKPGFPRPASTLELEKVLARNGLVRILNPKTSS